MTHCILEVAFEVVNFIVRGHANDVAIYVEDSFRWTRLLSDWNCLPKFPVSLTVQLVSPDEHCPCLLGSIEQQKICWQSLVLVHFDDHTNLQIHGVDDFESIVGQYFVFGGVHNFVSPVPLDVIECFFAHRNEEDEAQGC